jgi:hypothetical protein
VTEGSEATPLRLAAVGRGRGEARLGEMVASGSDMMQVEALVTRSYESSSSGEERG